MSQQRMIGVSGATRAEVIANVPLNVTQFSATKNEVTGIWTLFYPNPHCKGARS